MIRIKFGTDGWRGRIAEEYTFDNVRRCAQGFARYLLDFARRPEDLARGVVVGYDRRFNSEHFAAAVAEVLAGNGIPVWLTETATPTPVISYSIVAQKAIGGVNITASHNPPTDNGFKVRDEHGGAIDPEGLKEIERRIPDDMRDVKRIPLALAESVGLVRRFDPAPAYLEHLRDLIDLDPIRRAGLKVAVDPIWGNGAGWFPRLLAGGATEVHEIHSERNPIFPEMKRPEPIPPNVDAGLAFAQRIGADALIITDGDADRVGLGDEQGRFVDQLRVYGLLALYFLKIRGERGPIVKTLSTTSMLDILGEKYGVPVYHTGVGFKYVAPKMLETNAMIGGEESGGYAFRGHVPERDGILAGLYLLDFMVQTGKKPTELLDMLFEEVGATFYYKRIDIPLENNRVKEMARQRLEEARPERLAGLRVVDKVTIDGYKFVLEDRGWLLVRFSGTEPLIRVYCETTHEDRVDALLEEGQRLAGIL